MSAQQDKDIQIHDPGGAAIARTSRALVLAKNSQNICWWGHLLKIRSLLLCLLHCGSCVKSYFVFIFSSYPKFFCIQRSSLLYFFHWYVPQISCIFLIILIGDTSISVFICFSCQIIFSLWLISLSCLLHWCPITALSFLNSFDEWPSMTCICQHFTILFTSLSTIILTSC